MEINGGQSQNPTGSPVWPASTFTGPLVAGNVQNNDGAGTLAVVGGYNGLANTGYAEMAQTAQVTQASSAGTVIVIPAQSQITAIELMVTTAWTGAATTAGIGTTASATALTAAGAVSGAALGRVVVTPGTGATQIGNWVDVGNTDVQIIVTSTNTGSGVGYLTVHYLQGINLS
jgi:hypothetical protein